MYHTDNVGFKDSVFLEHLANKNQTIKFSGSGAAHQNGVAERAIGVVVAMARTMMIHAAMHQPEGDITPNYGLKLLIMPLGSTIKSPKSNMDSLQLNYGQDLPTYLLLIFWVIVTSGDLRVFH